VLQRGVIMSKRTYHITIERGLTRICLDYYYAIWLDRLVPLKSVQPVYNSVASTRLVLL